VLSGPTVAKDKNLIKGLLENFLVLKNHDNSHIETVLHSHAVDLVLIEVLPGDPNEIEQIRKIRAIWQDLAIILVNGTSRDLIARAFEYGIRDAFKGPYKADLLVDRAKAVIAKSGDSNLKGRPFENQ